MNPIIKAILLVLSVFSVGCSTTNYTVTGQPQDNTRVIFQDGRETLVSEQENTATIKSLSKSLKSGKRQSFIVAVHNRTDEEILFSEEDIQATYIDSEENRISGLKIYSYDELVKEEKRRQAWAAVGAAMSAAGDSISASQAGQSTTYGTYSGTTTSDYGSASSYGSFSSTTYDYGAAQAAQREASAKSDAEFARLAAQGKANLKRLSSIILKKHTVFPDKWHGGTIEIDMPTFSDTGLIEFQLKAGKENHKMVFQINKQN